MANFDAEAFEGCLDICAAGQFALFVDEDREPAGSRSTSGRSRRCTCGSTRADGRIDIVHREYTLTAEQAARVRRENVPEKIRKALERSPTSCSRSSMRIYPRTPHVPNARLAKNCPVASCHIELESKRLCASRAITKCP
jgi:hypothetical protein